MVESKGSVGFLRTDEDPRMKGRYEDIAINTATKINMRSHSALHSESMGKAIGQWITRGKAKFPDVILDDDGTGQ